MKDYYFAIAPKGPYHPPPYMPFVLFQPGSEWGEFWACWDVGCCAKICRTIDEAQAVLAEEYR